MGTLLRFLFGCSLLIAPLYAQETVTPVNTHAARLLDLLSARTSSPDDSLPAVRQSTAAGKKAPGLAALYSLLIPGMGELYAGDFSSGKYFLAAEGVLWLTYAACDITGNSLRDDARTFADARAGLTGPSKDDQLYIDVGNFNSLADYNDKRLRDRELSRVYDPARGYAWQWDSEVSRLTFRDQRIRSESMYNARKFVVAGILVNHVASAINAARAAIARNSAMDEALGDIRFSGGYVALPGATGGFVLRIERRF